MVAAGIWVRGLGPPMRGDVRVAARERGNRSAAAAIGIAIPPGTAHAYGEEFLVCPDGHSGIATTVTSCPFAENVRVAWFTQPGQVVEAYSPVTGTFYDMQCADGFMAYL